MIGNRQLLGCVQALASLPSVVENPSLSAGLAQLKEKVEKYEFQIVVIGQFKRGKSTLINALLGDNILPTAIVPLTSIVTILKYDKEKHIRVRYISGLEEEIEWSDLKEYVTESGNPHNRRGVDRVEVGYPSDLLMSGIQIVDTPGVGSIYQHNTDAARAFVPRADVGVFVITSDPPISDAELDFLRSIREHLAKFIFVLSKIDQVEERERVISLEFSRQIVEDTVGSKFIEFYPISAKLALEGSMEGNETKIAESGILMLRDWLASALDDQKDQIFLDSTSTKILGVAERIGVLLDIEAGALDTPVDSLRSKMVEFRRELDSIKREREESDYILQGQAERLADSMLIDDLDLLRSDALPKLLKSLDTITAENRDISGKEFSHTLDVFIESSIRRVFTEWRDQEQISLEKSLKEVMKSFEKKTEDSIQRVMGISAELFGSRSRSLLVDRYLAGQVEFKFSFDEIQVAMEVFRPLVSHLPRGLAHRLLFRRARDTLLEEFDRHCGRVRYDFHERVVRTVREYRRQLDETWEQLIDDISSALQRAAEQQTERAETRQSMAAAIEAERARLAEVQERLRALQFVPVAEYA